MLGLMGFSGSLPLYVIHRYYIFLLIGQIKMLPCLLVHLECHQQRSFTLKMHQNRWRLGLRPRPHCGSLQRPQIP